MNSQQLPRAEDGAYAGDKTPKETWDSLTGEPDAVLVDVRTEAEFCYVGVPDLSPAGKETCFVSWVHFPGGVSNPDFIDELRGAVPDQSAHVFFLCRSGVRSRYAAALASEAGYSQCFNVLEGFEGDKDADGHRGTVGGWKVAGLPWSQG